MGMTTTPEALELAVRIKDKGKKMTDQLLTAMADNLGKTRGAGLHHQVERNVTSN